MSRYETLDNQRGAYVDSVLMGLDLGGKENEGPYYDLLAAKLEWPLKLLLANDPSSWKSDAFADSQKHTFLITKQGYIGRGPRTLKQGDIVCILYGGGIPFILRPSGTEFYLLEECCKYPLDVRHI